MVLDRDRHAPLIEAIRKAGARVKLFTDGDVAAAIAVCFPETGVDLFVGTGGAPEGVIAAAAIKCLEGEMQGRLVPEDEGQLQRCIEMGLKDPRQLLKMDNLIGTKDAIFAATGVTNGELLKGVHFLGNDRAETYSVVMRVKTKTIRFVQAIHSLRHKPHLIMK